MSQSWTPLAPAAPKFLLKDHIGRLAFFTVGGLVTGINTENGIKDAVRVGVVLLDGPDAGAIFDDVLVFNVAPVARLRTMVGSVTLARIIAEGKNNAPALVDPYPGDDQSANGWCSYYPTKLQELLHATLAAHAEGMRAKPQQQQWVQPPLPNMPAPQPQPWTARPPMPQTAPTPSADPWATQAPTPPAPPATANSANATMQSLQQWTPNNTSTDEPPY